MNCNITELLFKKPFFETVTQQELAFQIEAKKSCEKKLPTWFTTPNIYYAKKINIEQTSSEKTAQYKASLVNGNTLIDLTGGFGVDCFYFSKKIKQATHCEINADLSEIVKHNYLKLNCKNIQTEITDGFEYLKNYKQQFDWVYIDPSRRNNLKGKVFLLNDCLPNVVLHLNTLFTKTNNVLIKTSPLLDIKKTITDLNFVKEVHIVAVKNEVKEILFLLQKNWNSTTSIHTINLTPKGNQAFIFSNQTETANYGLPQQFLYEPNSAILKSGGFHAIALRYNVYKLHQHSHLYTSMFLIDFPGRCFKILKTILYQKKTIKKRFKNKAFNITTRNFPKSVADIRKENHIKDGGTQYLFFTTNMKNIKIIVICEKIN